MNHLKVSSRLGWSFGTLTGLLALVAAISLVRLSGMNDAIDTVVNDRAPKVEALNDMAYRLMDNAQLTRNIILLTDAPGMAAAKQAYDMNLAANAQHLTDLKDRLHDAQDIALLAEIEEHRAAYNGYSSKVITAGLANQNDEAVKLLFGAEYKTQDAYFSSIRKLVESEKTKSIAAGTQAAEAYRAARTLIIAAAALACALGGGLGLLMTRGLLRQLGGEPAYATEVAQRIAAGDIGTPVATRDGDSGSLLGAMKAMQTSLAQVVSSVRQGSEAVATASAQIAQGNQDLSQRTEQQSSALQQTAASMEELSATVKLNAANATQANELARDASSVAVQGGDVVNQVVGTMKGINDASKKIADIIGVIDGIAFQTNILALNAAVEAARAGEQGRGFAVVASEVRNLAGRSADAAKEIKSLINASVERVEQGSALVDRAGTTMAEVVTSIKRVTDIMAEISHASVEQSTGVTQVGQAVADMDRATQQNAALVEQSAAAAESLRQQARQLVAAVTVFQLGRDGGAVATTPASRATPAPRHVPGTAASRPAVRTESAARSSSAAGLRPSTVSARPSMPKESTAASARRVDAVATPAGADDEWTSF